MKVDESVVVVIFDMIQKLKKKHVSCSLRSESEAGRRVISLLEQEEQQALWSAFKDVSQGPSVSWLSPAAMTGSQPSNTVVPLLQKTCTPTTLAAYPREEFIEMTALIYIPELRQGSAVSTFPPKHHLHQETELGSALLEERDECSSC